MKCTFCDIPLSRMDALYKENNLNIYCKDCLRDAGIPYYDIENYLKEHFPALAEMQKKALSTRLPLSQIIYVMKFAQENDLETVSQTLTSMVSRLQELEPLDVELNGSPFDANASRIRKKLPVSKFLEKKETVKETIIIGIPDALPNKEFVNEVEDEDGDVFTI